MKTAQLPEGSIRQGIESLRDGRPAAAQTLCRGHLREHPGDPDAMHLWGVTEHYAGRHEAAVRLIQAAITRRSDVADFHNSLGVAYAKLGRRDDAAAAFGRAIAMRPESDKFRKNLELLDETPSQPRSMASSDDAVWQSLTIHALDVSFPDGLEFDPAENQKLAPNALDIALGEWE